MGWIGMVAFDSVVIYKVGIGVRSLARRRCFGTSYTYSDTECCALIVKAKTAMLGYVRTPSDAA
jgi:hypothetical protein